jgi:hypothetical protein
VALHPRNQRNPWSFLKILSFISNFGRQILEKDDERKIMKNKLTETKFKSSLGLTCRFLLSYLAAALSLLAATATGQTWNLRTEWSNTQNPNGVWSYRAGNLVLPAQPNHESSFCWLSPQFAWARSSNDNDRMPALYRHTAPFIFECLRVTEIECGDIATHTDDPYGGIGGLPSVFAWTSPMTGLVSVTGAIWLGRDVGRSVDWSVKLNGTLLTSGTVYSGDPYSRATPFDFATGSGGSSALHSIAVVPGDEITFEATQGSGSPNGDIVGVKFTVTADPGGPEGDTVPPMADAGPDQSLYVGDEVLLDGSNSFDDTSASNALAFYWCLCELPSMSTATLIGATTATPSFHADQPGTYRVRLVVTDEAGNISDRDEVVISINSAPTPACAAQVQPPINADGTSIFNVRRGVVPVKFRLTCDGSPTCDLAPATIAVTRTGGGVIGEINESVYSGTADSGSNFRVLECQYHYNLNSRALGAGTYRVDILINGQVVGSAAFQLE